MSTTLPRSERVCSLNNVSQWGPWEVYREVYANTLDADPDGHILHFPNASSFDVFTHTSPTYADCVAIGESSKEYNGSTIGQFGEGLKVAAVTAARLGGSLTVSTPSFLGKYTIRQEDGFRHPTLWFESSAPSPTAKGCTICVTLPGGNFAQYQPRFVTRSLTYITKPSPNPASIYCRGVYVDRASSTSLFDYNVTFELTRDRSAPSSSVYAPPIAKLLTETPPDDISLRLFFTSAKDCEFELLCLRHRYYGRKETPLCRDLTRICHELYGERVVLMDESTTSATLQRAAREGYRVIQPDYSLVPYLDIPHIDSIKAKSFGRPSRFCNPPPGLLAFYGPLQLALSNLSARAPTLIFAEPDDEDRPLIYHLPDQSAYIVTVGVDDDALPRLLFALVASSLGEQLTSQLSSDLGLPSSLWAAATLYCEQHPTSK
mgnify:CR=1 FL=1